jgi:hypothetical protein
MDDRDDNNIGYNCNICARHIHTEASHKQAGWVAIREDDSPQADGYVVEEPAGEVPADESVGVVDGVVEDAVALVEAAASQVEFAVAQVVFADAAPVEVGAAQVVGWGAVAESGQKQIDSPATCLHTGNINDTSLFQC